jgi:uncharacterized protein YqjF (DUF2071 family)
LTGRPWVMRMRWTDLLFAHWPFDVTTIRLLVPPELELDTYDDVAWIGIVPFRMEDVAPRGLPALPGLSVFPELNVRTYVRHEGSPGVWFLSLDAASWPTVVGARRFFRLPYVHAAMSIGSDGETIDYRSTRRDRSAPPATFLARYRPTGPIERAEPGSFEAWSTARWRLFALDASGRVMRGEIRHRDWPLQPAWADLDAAGLAAAHGLSLPGQAPHLCFSRRVDVRAWWPRPSTARSDARVGLDGADDEGDEQR